MVDYISTTYTGDNFDPTATTTTTGTEWQCCDCEYEELEYTKRQSEEHSETEKKETLEYMRLGWHNPRKINRKEGYSKSKLKMTIRNSLPKKIRKD